MLSPQTFATCYLSPTNKVLQHGLLHMLSSVPNVINCVKLAIHMFVQRIPCNRLSFVDQALPYRLSKTVV